jgi:hypothetical protein
VPLEDPPPSAVVVFCDILEYDPYTPLRVGLSMRIRRATDGMELVALQGTWIGTPPITPRLPPFHWLMRKLPPRPNVDFTWTAQFETQSATELVRVAVDQCVSQLQSGQRTTQAFVPGEMPPQFEEPVPPAPPALPEATPPPAIDSPIDVLPAPEATTLPPPTPGISTLDEPESAPCSYGQPASATCRTCVQVGRARLRPSRSRGMKSITDALSTGAGGLRPSRRGGTGRWNVDPGGSSSSGGGSAELRPPKEMRLSRASASPEQITG